MPQFATKYRQNQGRVKALFVSQVLSETAQRIREDQNRVVDEWDLFESGKVKSMLSGHFSVDSSDNSGKLHMRYLTYYRFLDMPDPRRRMRQAKRDGYHTYNRIVFGILYNYGLPELMYGYTKEVYEQISGDLDKAMDVPKSIYKRADMMVKGIADHDRFTAAILSKRMRTGYK